MIPKLIIATPVRGVERGTASVTLGYSDFVRLLSQEMPIDTVVTFAADVVRARNRIVAGVLRDYPTVSHVLWVDEDTWPEDRGLVLDMVASGEDVVGAAYTNKSQPLRWVHQPLQTSPEPDPKGLQEVRAVGFGFTLTSTECLRRMSSAARRYTDYPNLHRVPNVFGLLYDRLTESADPEDETLLSEDFSFCKRWRDLGGKIKVHPGGIIYHAGTHAWSAREKPGAIKAG